MNKKIVVLLSSISLLLVSATAFTFAWFAEGRELRVENVKIEIRGEKELQISTTGEEGSYVESLSKDDLTKVDKFVPVSSVNSDMWISEKAQMPQFRGSYTPSKENPVAGIASSGYYSQELYLYSKTDDLYATIDRNSVIFEPDVEKNKTVISTVKQKYPNLTDDEILNNLNSINKSLRISVLVPHEDYYQYVIVDPYKDEDTYFGGTLDLSNNGYYDYYQKNGVKYESVYGDLSDRSKIVYDDASSTDSTLNNNELATCFVAKHKSGVKTFNREKSEANGLVIAKEKSLNPFQAEMNLGIPVFVEKPNKIVLSIYLEGWDKDNTNLAMYAYFKVGLKFKISETKGELII